MEKSEDILRWFVHDSNNSIYHINTLIENYLEGGTPRDDLKLVQAKAHCAEALHMNALLAHGLGASRSVKENVETWAQWKSYPKVEVEVVNDHKLFKFQQARYLIAVLSETAKNAHKGGGSRMDIKIDGNIIMMSNDGDAVENPEKMFEKGFSTFGTTGEGLGMIQKMCRFGGFTYELVSAEKPVTFKLTIK